MTASIKREKFVELAKARVNTKLKDLQLIGNLSNCSVYEFTDADVRKIFGVLQKALESVKGRFTYATDGGGGEFKL